ncbi:hypothetical protein GTA62_14585 [Roseobacter sp. HKCCD9010]|uniref:hypothetical protein n=1 Tax=unclassified Roseobacter TaxID=196798 RepID=UPI001491E853|nr:MULTISPECIES: hypothetical protein [unclassified Roseobacter]MBF9050663.1 hypothetical protein [Rhodobacterales bacterium HKCCD4356]NNV11919.1 hypothetical protein [Roseobacter sp. HKCCD7357]NNV16932.1 hypothetical protein [Roseobacter sp. HKCCD8768]NNV26161.1 hypothetical protein [Roseobacter sp. HKCCD8192]NNV30653.1 hypothetical protein [Roseobacter sp. HKCCD9061]
MARHDNIAALPATTPIFMLELSDGNAPFGVFGADLEALADQVLELLPHMSQIGDWRESIVIANDETHEWVNTPTRSEKAMILEAVARSLLETHNPEPNDIGGFYMWFGWDSPYPDGLSEMVEGTEAFDAACREITASRDWMDHQADMAIKEAREQ